MKYVKRIVLVALLLGTAVLLALPTRPSEPVPQGRVVIRYWEKWSGREADAMKRIVDEFNNTVGKEKNIWVEYISMSQIEQKTLVATAANVPPDVAGLFCDQLSQFAAMGALEPLDKLAEKYGLTRDYYKPVYYEGCQYDGRLYAMPSTPGAAALFWNKKIFAERADRLRAAGLDPTRPPRTIDELDRYSQALEVWSAPKEQGGRLIAAGYLEQQPGWWIEDVSYWFGGSIYDPQLRKFTFTDPKVIAAFQWLKGYTDRIGVEQLRGFFSSLPDNVNFDAPVNPFMTGAVAMVKEGPWFANTINAQKPEMSRWKMSKEEERKLPREQRKQNYMWGAAPFPSAVPGEELIGFAGTDIWVIPSTSQHKAEAFEFIAFCSRQEQMEKLCMLHCKNSPLAKVSQHYLDDHPNPYIDVFDALSASPYVHGLPPVPTWPQVKRELRFVAQRVSSEDAPVEPTLEIAQDRMQSALDRFLEIQDRRSAKTK
jgi:multiple sugar transport system substrate-binding protein